MKIIEFFSNTKRTLIKLDAWFNKKKQPSCSYIYNFPKGNHSQRNEHRNRQWRERDENREIAARIRASSEISIDEGCDHRLGNKINPTCLTNDINKSNIFRPIKRQPSRRIRSPPLWHDPRAGKQLASMTKNHRELCKHV